MTRRAWSRTLLILVLLATALSAVGQARQGPVAPNVISLCGTVYDSYSLQCPGCPGEFYDQVIYDTPGSTAIWQRIFFCCNGGWVWDTWEGGLCWITKLEEPATREKLARLAAKEDILIPSCDGTLLPAELFL